MYNEGYFYNAIKRDIAMVKGDTMAFGFQVKGLEGVEPSKIKFSCKSTIEDEYVIFAVSNEDTIDLRSYDPETDIFTYTVRIPPKKTANLELGRYFYDLKIEVNNDVITLMIGRLSIEFSVEGDPDPATESGDDIKYPIADIPLGSVKIYTEQYVSDLASIINVINSDPSGKYDISEMYSALFDIDNEILDISDAINAKTGGTSTITLANLASTITNQLDIIYPNGTEVYY